MRRGAARIRRLFSSTAAGNCTVSATTRLTTFSDFAIYERLTLFYELEMFLAYLNVNWFMKSEYRGKEDFPPIFGAYWHSTRSTATSALAVTGC